MPTSTQVTVTISAPSAPMLAAAIAAASDFPDVWVEVDHSRCDFRDHDHDFDTDEDPPEQAHEGLVRLCNHGDGATLFYCQRDDCWHHGGLLTEPCFLVSDQGREACVYSRHPQDPRSGPIWEDPQRRVCVTHDPLLSLGLGETCPAAKR